MSRRRVRRPGSRWASDCAREANRRARCRTRWSQRASEDVPTAHRSSERRSSARPPLHLPSVPSTVRSAADAIDSGCRRRRSASPCSRSRSRSRARAPRSDRGASLRISPRGPPRRRRAPLDGLRPRRPRRVTFGTFRAQRASIERLERPHVSHRPQHEAGSTAFSAATHRDRGESPPHLRRGIASRLVGRGDRDARLRRRVSRS